MSTADDTKKDENQPTMEQVVVLGLFGLFVVLPTAFIGTYFSYVYFASATMAYVMGFSFVLATAGLLGFFTVLIKQSIREVVIKVVQNN
jgi:hypothetical protein